MERKRKQNDDVKADIQLLLECLDYQKGNTSAMKQAMVTLSSAICDSGFPDAKDIFRSAGGIQKILNIVTTSKTDEIVEVGLFCLGNAVEKNVYSQKLLSNASFFNFLHGVLSPSVTTVLRKRQMAAFILLCLVSNNSFGQNMARQSSCLHDILTLIRTTLSKNYDSNRGRTVELWATLVRAACVCVNNPVNEENQRICSTLFPYLLNVLGNQGDDNILKPVLSLMCLTVSYNAQNQGKLTRCGGLQILVQKLKSILNDRKEQQQQTAIQLICTLDVCLTENESNSKIFGDLGGISLVINMLQHPNMGSHDKTQLVLILAHAVDSYASNKEHISQGNGIKILIQQMTESSDEELTKTTKYLLHMCVSSDDNGYDEEEDVHTSDAYAAKLEHMKKCSDLEILQKLNDLDSKLKDIEGRDTDNRNHYGSIDSLEKQDICLSDMSELHLQPSVNRPSSVCSSNSVNCRHKCPTPREKTLMDELIKEKIEKEKLEKLNQLLQEDVVTSRAALAKTEKLKTHNKSSHRREGEGMASFRNWSESSTGIKSKPLSEIELNQLSNRSKEPYMKGYDAHADFHNLHQTDSFDPKHDNDFRKSALPYNSNSNDYGKSALPFNSNSNDYGKSALPFNSNNNDYGKSALPFNSNNNDYGKSSLPFNSNNDDFGKGALPFNSNSGLINYSGVKPNNNEFYAYPMYKIPSNSAHERRSDMYLTGNVINHEVFTHSNMPVDRAIDNSCEQSGPSMEQERMYHAPGAVKDAMINNTECRPVHNQTFTNSMAQTVNYYEKGTTSKQNQTLSVSCDKVSDIVNVNNSSVTRSQNAEIQCGNSSVTRSQNAEIQCGTPYVNTETANTADNNKTVDESCQTHFIDRANNQKRKLIETSTGTSGSSTSGPSRDTANLYKTRKISPRTSGSSTTGPSRDTANLNKTGKISPQMKVAKVVIQDVVASTSPKISSGNGKLNIVEKDCTSTGKVAAPITNNQSNETFLRPIAAPPRKKVRITPLMGSRKVLNSCRIDVQKTTNQPTPDFSDLESEFDQQLVRAIKKVTHRKVTYTEVNPSLMYGAGHRVKSQNNTRKIDRHLNDSQHDATDIWKATPTTPDNQHTVPARPAFSDCGTRRYNVFESPYSAKSVDCLRKNSLHDTGLNTPADMKHGSPNSVDSDIEGCRSNSDDSEEETKSLNITTTVLRSHLKPAQQGPRLCPGCHFSTDEKGKALTSRTYNHMLERCPHTCKYHRQLRVYERSYIKTKKRELGKRRRESGRLLNFEDLCPEKLTTLNSYDFESSNGDAAQVTPPFKDEASDVYKFKLPKPRRPRRERIPYTFEEENNLIEGVRTLGKHWNQILVTYNFHPSRTNVDLMDKFKRMAAADSGLSEINSTKPSKYSKPFSLCEERRLRKGVKMFGSSWKSILQAYQFEKGRTSEELRNKWRGMEKHLELN